MVHGCWPSVGLLGEKIALTTTLIVVLPPLNSLERGGRVCIVYKWWRTREPEHCVPAGEGVKSHQLFAKGGRGSSLAANVFFTSPQNPENPRKIPECPPKPVSGGFLGLRRCPQNVSVFYTFPEVPQAPWEGMSGELSWLCSKCHLSHSKI